MFARKCRPYALEKELEKEISNKDKEISELETCKQRKEEDAKYQKKNMKMK